MTISEPCTETVIAFRSQLNNFILFYIIVFSPSIMTMFNTLAIVGYLNRFFIAYRCYLRNLFLYFIRNQAAYWNKPALI